MTALFEKVAEQVADASPNGSRPFLEPLHHLVGAAAAAPRGGERWSDQIPTTVNDRLRPLQPSDLDGMNDRDRAPLTADTAALKVVSLDAPRR